jgi:hypothetical protein
MQRHTSEQQPTCLRDLFRRSLPPTARPARMRRIAARHARLYTRDCPCEAVTIRVKDWYRTIMRAVRRRRPDPAPLVSEWRRRRALEFRARRAAPLEQLEKRAV